MKTIIRRLCRLEETLAPQAADEEVRIANLLRERRRRRLEASGLPYEERPVEPYPRTLGRRATWAEVLRERRALRTAQGRPGG
jgi:hypothetical protein